MLSYHRRNVSWRFLTLAVVLLAIVGEINALLILIKEKTTNTLICFGSNSCETVLSSSYAYVLGVPVVWLGILFYLAVFMLGCVALARHGGTWTKALAGVSFVGFLFSLYLFAIQWFVLGAFCYYCIVSFVDALVIFGIMVFLLIKNSGPFFVSDKNKAGT